MPRNARICCNRIAEAPALLRARNSATPLDVATWPRVDVATSRQWSPNNITVHCVDFSSSAPAQSLSPSTSAVTGRSCNG
eukprot:8741492-Pyramimonas_sp.AAC.1